MNLGSRRMLVGGAAIAAACILCPAFADAQTTPGGRTTAAAKPPMAEDVFRNVQVLRGIPMDEFMGTMGFFASALSLNCIDCHVAEAATDWSKYAEDTPLKQTARKMVLMVKSLNQSSFGGKPAVTCYTCHRSSDTPKVVPSLTEQYGVVPDIDPDDVKSGGRGRAPGGPTADQILDKYLQALGGAQRLTDVTSFIARGTYEGFDTADSKVPAEVYAKAPAQRTTVVHAVGEGGAIKDSTTVYDGSNGWVAARNTLVPMLTLTGGNLDGAKVDAELSFPARIKEVLVNWSADFPETKIDDRLVQVVQGTSGASIVKLYFDKQSGLLLRQLRYANTLVGPNPTEIDYSDYREVSGIKMSFRWVVSWTDGRSTIEIKDVQLNAPIGAAKFAKPAP